MMKTIHPAALALLLIGQAWATAPPRPPQVPEKAVWAGGVDGGAWIDCSSLSKEPWGPLFKCTTYNDHTGQVWSQGWYVIGYFENQTFRRVQRFVGQPRYTAFDGETIRTESKDLIMVPRGEIDYPFSETSGKRITYDHAKQEGPEVTY